MSASGSRETRTQFFDAASLAELGKEVDAYLAGDLEDWTVESVSVDADVRMLRDHAAKFRRASIRYSASVTLARHRA